MRLNLLGCCRQSEIIHSLAFPALALGLVSFYFHLHVLESCWNLCSKSCPLCVGPLSSIRLHVKKVKIGVQHYHCIWQVRRLKSQLTITKRKYKCSFIQHCQSIITICCCQLLLNQQFSAATYVWCCMLLVMAMCYWNQRLKL